MPAPARLPKNGATGWGLQTHKGPADDTRRACGFRNVSVVRVWWHPQAAFTAFTASTALSGFQLV